MAYLDSVQARLASLRELQSQTQEELDALLPSPKGMLSHKGTMSLRELQSATGEGLS
jgi:hypothetical protein